MAKNKSMKIEVRVEYFNKNLIFCRNQFLSNNGNIGRKYSIIITNIQGIPSNRKHIVPIRRNQQKIAKGSFLLDGIPCNTRLFDNFGKC